MSKCLFCEKEIEQPKGKRKKEFCNNTCRSNQWYKMNRKGTKITEKKLIQIAQNSQDYRSKVMSDMEAEFQEILKKKQNANKQNS